MGAIPVSISADPADPEVQAIAAFLRVLNALENIRSSINVAERGRRMHSADDMRELAGLSVAEAIDAIEVLSSGALSKAVEPDILSARVRLLAAKLALQAVQQIQNPQAIDKVLDTAVRHLRAARSSLADPSSLPPSFRN
jgi:hypothetical protein